MGRFSDSFIAVSVAAFMGVFCHGLHHAVEVEAAGLLARRELAEAL
jgi:hypothetical protein